MKNRALLEMSVESLDAALAAARGGADRIELCENLAVGGVTPEAALMRAAREQIQVPIFAMIRPRGGDFCYTAAEFDAMKDQIRAAQAAEMDGVVLGILTADARVDVGRVAKLVELAKPLPVTFHRAFDELAPNGRQDGGCRDLMQGLEDVIAAGPTRLLTSGGEATAEEGCMAIAGLVRQARGRIIVLPGGGVRPSNLSRIAQETRASEFHSGLSNMLPYPRHDHDHFEAGVRELVRVLEEEPRNLQPATGD